MLFQSQILAYQETFNTILFLDSWDKNLLHASLMRSITIASARFSLPVSNEPEKYFMEIKVLHDRRNNDPWLLFPNHVLNNIISASSAANKFCYEELKFYWLTSIQLWLRWKHLESYSSVLSVDSQN